jgi:immune inhibitor A
MGGMGGADAGASQYGDNAMLQQQIAMLEARLAALEMGQGAASAQPFIGAELRPDLAGQAQPDQAAAELQQRMAAGDRDAKSAFDNLPSCSS